MNETTNPSYSPVALLPIVGIPIFLAISNQTMVSVALPAIGAELGAVMRLPWLVVGYMLALTIAGPVYGVLGDTHGRPKMLLTALGVYIVGSFICAAANSIEILASGRLIQGLGGGGLMVLSQSLIGQLVLARDRGKAQGYVATIGVTASTLGPVLGGLLVESLGWRSLFLATVPIAMLGAAVILRLDLPRVAAAGSVFDFRGFFWLTGFVLAWSGALELLKTPGHAMMAGLCLIGGAASLAALIRSQSLSDNSMFPPELFAIPTIQRASVMVTCHGAALVSLVTIIPLYQNIVRGETTVDIVFSLLALTVALGLSGVVTGHLITATGRTGLYPALCLPVAVVGLVVLAFFGSELSKFAQTSLYILIGLTIGTVMAVVHTTVQYAAPDPLRGRAAGAVTFFRSIGGVLGTAIVSLVLFAMAPDTHTVGANVDTVFSVSGEMLPEDAATWRRAFRWALLTVALFVASGWSMASTLPTRRII